MLAKSTARLVVVCFATVARSLVGASLIAVSLAMCLPAAAQSVPARRDGSLVVAQNYDGRAQRRQPGGFQERPPPQSQGFSLRRLFGLDDPPPPQPTIVRRPRPRAPVVRQERAKPQAANRVVVFGDWLADSLAQGLDESFSEMPNVAIARRTRGDLGLVQQARADWVKLATDYLNSKQRVTIAAIMLGMSDRTALVEGSERIDPLSERWKEIYSARVDGLLAVFVNRGIPVVWVGLPPVADEKAAEQYAAINEIVRQRVGVAGAAYVDIWPGFVDEDNRYIAIGPDANGEPTKLRFNDGIRFTRKGAEKLGHYVATEIRRLLGTNLNPAHVPTALPGSGAGGEPFIDIDRTVMSPDTPIQLETSAVRPLTRTEIAPGGVLLRGTTELNSADAAKRAFREGLPTPPLPGRMDDYRVTPR